METVVVGLSGGVDSSVAAYLLKKQGYDVVGLFMHNWEEQDGSGRCNAQADFEDARRVADALEIPYYTVNYSKEYMDRVFKYFLEDYANGLTPNPDVMCNREIKFGPFLKHAMSIGAGKMATGHYAKVKFSGSKFLLYKADDESKDQSYFLHQLSQEQLSKTLFPLASLKKTEVRRIAAELGLVTAKKKDSTGICFIGERNFRQFMKNYLPAQKGKIVDLDGKVVGEHEGVMYYTLGQRRGLNIGGRAGGHGDRWFVVDKDVKKNVLIVNEGECPEMYSKRILVEEINFIAGEPCRVGGNFECFVKCRYRQADQKCSLKLVDKNKAEVTFDTKQKAVTPGQYAVFYGENGICYGGGKIIKKYQN